MLFVGVSLNAKRAVSRLPKCSAGRARGSAGAAGALARENAMRNPSTDRVDRVGADDRRGIDHFRRHPGRRVCGASFSDAVDKFFVADYAVTAENGFDPFTKSRPAALWPWLRA